MDISCREGNLTSTERKIRATYNFIRLKYVSTECRCEKRGKLFLAWKIVSMVNDNSCLANKKQTVERCMDSGNFDSPVSILSIISPFGGQTIDTAAAWLLGLIPEVNIQ